jgi:predicted transcriptional regulator with HTH domain
MQNDNSTSMRSIKESDLLLALSYLREMRDQVLSDPSNRDKHLESLITRLEKAVSK